LATVGSLTGGTTRRYSTRRTKSSTARQVSDAIDWTDVLRHVLRNTGKLELNSLRHAQPVETDQRVNDVVGSAEMIRQSRRRIQHRLEAADQVNRKARQLLPKSRPVSTVDKQPASGTSQLAPSDESAGVDVKDREIVR